jgi:hypothetical protein
MLKPHVDLEQRFLAQFSRVPTSYVVSLLEDATQARSVLLLMEFSTGQLDATAPKV